jgi:hypothetical protein
MCSLSILLPLRWSLPGTLPSLLPPERREHTFWLRPPSCPPGPRGVPPLPLPSGRGSLEVPSPLPSRWGGAIALLPLALGGGRRGESLSILPSRGSPPSSLGSPPRVGGLVVLPGEVPSWLLVSGWASSRFPLPPLSLLGGVGRVSPLPPPGGRRGCLSRLLWLALPPSALPLGSPSLVPRVVGLGSPLEAPPPSSPRFSRVGLG